MSDEPEGGAGDGVELNHGAELNSGADLDPRVERNPPTQPSSPETTWEEESQPHITESTWQHGLHNTDSTWQVDGSNHSIGKKNIKIAKDIKDEAFK